MPRKIYLGDAVYAEDGSYKGEIILTTEDGVRATNTIIIDPDILKLLNEFAK